MKKSDAFPKTRGRKPHKPKDEGEARKALDELHRANLKARAAGKKELAAKKAHAKARTAAREAIKSRDLLLVEWTEPNLYNQLTQAAAETNGHAKPKRGRKGGSSDPARDTGTAEAALKIGAAAG